MNYNNVLNRAHPQISPRTYQSPPKTMAETPCNISTLKKLREDLIATLHQISEYEGHLTGLTDQRLINLYQNLRDMEIMHAGKLLGAIDYICPREQELRAMGHQDFTNPQN